MGPFFGPYMDIPSRYEVAITERLVGRTENKTCIARMKLRLVKRKYEEDMSIQEILCNPKSNTDMAKSCQIMQSQPWLSGRLPIPALLVDSTWQYRHRAVSRSQYNPKEVLCVVLADLVVVDNIDPRKNVDKQLGVPRVSGSHALDIRRKLGMAVQRLALLHLVNHLPHIHVHFPRVLGEPVEALCFRSVQSIKCQQHQCTYGKIAGKEHGDHR